MNFLKKSSLKKITLIFTGLNISVNMYSNQYLSIDFKEKHFENLV